MAVHYLEIVSNDVDTLTALYERMHDWFREAIEEELPAADASATADRPLALIDGYGVRALLGDPGMPLERAREEIWAALAPAAAPQEVF